MLEYKIDGPVLEEGIPLHIATTALQSFHGIIDKTYLVSIGSKKMTARDRDVFQLRASSFSRGSLLTKFEIIVSTFQYVLPIISSLEPNTIWQHTKNTFDFLKIVCNAVQKGTKPSYHFENAGDVTVQVGDNHFHFNSQIPQIGEFALPSYQKLAHLIEPNKINHISAGECDQATPDIFLGESDKEIFDIPTKIDKETIPLKCEIFNFDKFKNTGKLAVTVKGQDVEKGTYNFSIFGSQDNIEYIQSMLKREVELFCLIEFASNPFGEDNIYKLHVTGVK